MYFNPYLTRLFFVTYLIKLKGLLQTPYRVSQKERAPTEINILKIDVDMIFKKLVSGS